ncbi:unnamed protein product [marine sediment metagenome]|uniref:Uncharacterized protein n=1 Tax=marine sediment metagenome TaxID=412755 RepID=X1FN58_9ZZZZ
MNKKLPDELAYNSIQELLDEKNPKFYNLLKEIFNLKVIRAVELCTFLLNYSIQHNYFKWFQVLLKEFPDHLPRNDDPLGLQEYLIGTERLSGIILFLCLTYKTIANLTEEDTDRKINELHLSIPLLNQFFMFNTFSPINYNADLAELLELSKSYSSYSTLIPDLGFDPDYKPVLNCDALKQTYDTSTMKDFLNNKMLKPPRYLPDKKIVLRSAHSSQNPDKKIFDIDSSLTISQFMIKSVNDLGGLFFTSEKQIDAIIAVFKNYYIKKIPSKKSEIVSYLSCFGEILKLCEGRLYFK